MGNTTPAYRFYLINKLKDTKKPFANRVAEIMEIDEISDLQVKITMIDCIIELEKLLEEKDKQIKNLLEHSDFDNAKK